MNPKIAIITGVSAGIGHLLAKILIEEKNYIVIGCARREEPLRILQKNYPNQFFPVIGDITSTSVQTAMLEKAGQLGRLDVLINNAGFGLFTPLEKMPVEKMRMMVSVNCIALTELCIASIPLLEKSKGLIVNVSSIVGHFGIPFSAVYSATKHFVNGLTRSLRIELYAKGIRVIAICPGSTESEFFSVAAVGREISDSQIIKKESTEKVVNGIVRKLEYSRLWLFPTFHAKFYSFIGRHFQCLFDRILIFSSQKLFAKRVN